MRALYLLLISLICSCSFFASKKTDPDSGLSYVYQNETTFKQIKFPAEQFYTSNGIKVVIVPRYDTEVVSYFTIVRVGSKHEQPGQRGLAHLLEHLMFRGSKKFPDGKYDKVLEANGGSNNAYTTQDATVYYASTPADKIEKIIELESDRLTNLTFTQEHFDKEREVVSEERKLRVDESAVGKMYHHMMKENFYGTAYQHDVLGEKDDLKQLSVDDVYAFYRKYYVPNNTTILVVGNVSASGTYNMIEDYYGQLPNPTQILEDPKISFRKRRMRSLDLRGNSNSPLVMMSFKGANLTQKEKHSLEIISSLLADGKSSYLAQNYVESDRPKLSYIESENIELKNGTSVVIHAQMLPKVGIWWLEKNLRKNIDSSCKIMINERNIQKAKNQYLMKLIEKLSTSHGIADYLAEIETNFEDFAFYQKDLEVISHLEVDEVMETCKKYISSSNGLFISLWNRNPIRRPR